ncbi:50S ribosomal protein L18 [Buchnera aphidicola (Eriosoma lanigerum)]
MSNASTTKKKFARLRRARRVRCQLKKLGVIRLVVHRSSRHMYAQIIVSENAKVLVSASTLERNIFSSLKYTGNQESAAILGRIIAERAINKTITSVSFDRSGFQYHGRVKALAESARKSGLKF